MLEEAPFETMNQFLSLIFFSEDAASKHFFTPPPGVPQRGIVSTNPAFSLGGDESRPQG
jgi:hypothetical protein